MKRLFCIGFLIFCVFSVQRAKAQTKQGEAILYGKLVNFGSVAELEEFSDLQQMVPKSFNPNIPVAADSSFSVTVPLDKPCYYRLGRNKLYLTPGDKMNVYIDRSSPNLAVFKGKGSEANTYLKKAAFPKGGALLEAGRNLLSTPWESFQSYLGMVAERQKELQSLNGVSPVFVRLEKARLRGELIKTFQMAENYIYPKYYKEHESFRKLYAEEFKQLSQKMLDSLVRNFIHEDYLQIEVYRDIVGKLDMSKATPSQKQIISDWEKAIVLAFYRIKPENDKSRISEFIPSVDSIKTKKYRDMLHVLIKDKMKFGNGDVAIDLEFRNPDGTTAKLSSLKGKVIYMDIWATWCGPCMGEMPNFEKLKEKYKGNPGIAIVSLSIDDNDPDWLRNVEKRKADGIQWRIDRPKLLEYGVETVPRYILIDKNFRIAEMNAPRAAEPELINMLEKLLAS